METIESTPAVKSAERVLDVFELLADADQGLTHSEIASALGIPKGSLTKLLKSLVARGYLTLDERRRTHTLGPSVRLLIERPANVQRLVDAATPLLQGLTRDINESSALNRLNGQSAEVIATALSTQRLVSHLREGDLAPLHAVSGGKAILANLPADKLAHYLTTAAFQPVTPHTILKAEDIAEDLAAVRETGVAYSYQEYTPGIIGIGVYISLPPGYPMCSINVAIPEVRMTETLKNRAIKALRDVRDALEARVESVEKSA